MICLCGSCIHSGTCTGDNDDYADEQGGLCVHYRRKQTDTMIYPQVSGITPTVIKEDNND